MTSQGLYPPLDRLKPLATDLWTVDSGPLTLLGLVAIPLRMTVARIPGGIMLISPTRYDATLMAEIARLGPIRHLVAPNTAHWLHVAAWQAACPDALVWGAPGLAARRAVQQAGLRIDHTLDATAPDAWGGAFDLAVVPGGFGFHEAALLHRESRTAVLTDLVQNFEPARLSTAMGMAVRLIGSDGGTPRHLRAVIRPRKHEAAAAARRILDAEPERVVVAHGRCIEADGAAVLRRALRWLIP